MIRKCLECGREFNAVSGRQRMCSPECRKARLAKQNRARHQSGGARETKLNTRSLEPYRAADAARMKRLRKRDAEFGAANVPRSEHVNERGLRVEIRGNCCGAVGANSVWQNLTRFR